MYHLSDDESLLPTYATLLGSFLGCFGAAAIILSSIRSPVKAMSRRIINVISIADLLQAFPVLVGACWHLEFHASANSQSFADIVGISICKWQSFVVTTGTMLSFLWTYGLAQHMFLLVTRGIKSAYKGYIALYPLSVVPFVINIIAFDFNVLGLDNRTAESEHNVNWCWITVDNSSANHTLTPWYKRPCPAIMWDGKGWEMASYLGVSVFCLLTYTYLRRMRRGELQRSNDTFGVEQAREASVQVNKLLLMPLVFVATRLCGTVYAVSCFCFSPHNLLCNSTTLIILKNFCDPFQGFSNWVLYGLMVGCGFKECCNCLCPETMRRLRGLGKDGTRSSQEPRTVWVTNDSSTWN